MAINGKPRVVIWFVSNDGRFIGNAVNILERQFNGIETVGVTAGQKISVTDAAGKVLPFIPLNEISLNGGGYDVLLVAGAKNFGMSEVVKFAKSINLDTEKLLGDWIVCIPGFTLDKYRQLQQTKLSFLSMTCFGAMISHTLGLENFSPFKNLYFTEEEFIRFLRHPRVYLEEEMVFQKKLWNPVDEVDFPVGTLGNISVHFMHYKSFEEALSQWNRRKNKINWYNLLPVMYTSDPEVLEQFDSLPYGKKICFTSLKSNRHSAFYINPELYKEKFDDLKKNHWHKVEYNKPNPPDGRIELIIHLWLANGVVPFYDVFDMLLYGKKTQLIDM